MLTRYERNEKRETTKFSRGTKHENTAENSASSPPDFFPKHRTKSRRVPILLPWPRCVPAFRSSSCPLFINGAENTAWTTHTQAFVSKQAANDTDHYSLHIISRNTRREVRLKDPMQHTPKPVPRGERRLLSYTWTLHLSSHLPRRQSVHLRSRSCSRKRSCWKMEGSKRRCHSGEYVCWCVRPMSSERE